MACSVQSHCSVWVTVKQTGESNIRKATNSFFTNADNFIVNSWLYGYCIANSGSWKQTEVWKKSTSLHFKLVSLSGKEELHDAVTGIICQNQCAKIFFKNWSTLFPIAATAKLITNLEGSRHYTILVFSFFFFFLSSPIPSTI